MTRTTRPEIPPGLPAPRDSPIIPQTAPPQFDPSPVRTAGAGPAPALPRKPPLPFTLPRFPLRLLTLVLAAALASAIACGGPPAPAPAVPPAEATPAPPAATAPEDEDGTLGVGVRFVPYAQTRARTGEPSDGVTDEQRQAMRELERLGYVAGSEPAPDAGGVTVHDRALAQPGLSFYVSGHAPWAGLMDMEGTLVHEWSFDFAAAFPDYSNDGKPNDSEQYWRRAFLRPNGDVLAIHEGIGLLKVDRGSNLLWSRLNRAHHDLEFDAEGRILVLTREVHLPSRFSADQPVLLDYVSILSPEGGEIRRISIDEAYRNSAFPAPSVRAPSNGDIYHTNAIELLDGRWVDRSPAFADGNLLLSFRNISTLVVLDPRQEKLVWVTKGPWNYQHQPTFVEDGRILLFDNRGGRPENGVSRILEFDPLTLEMAWVYEGTPELPFRCWSMGSVQRLANGNTLVSDSMNGRAFELTPAKSVVWEYVNPHRTGANGELIAVLPELVRVDAATLQDGLTDSAPVEPPAHL